MSDGGQYGYTNPQMAPDYDKPPPVTGQPGQPGQLMMVQQMMRPAGIPGVPPGLEYLTQIDQLLIHQQVELLEVLTGFETENKYQIKNTLGQQVYFAAEESPFCQRMCCGPSRGFAIHIVDNLGQEVIRARREFKCCAGCNWCANCLCCAMELQVEAPVGQVVGNVRQLQSCMKPRYSVMDANMSEVFYVEGPTCICQGPCCTADQEFVVFSADRAQQLGKLSKQWSGVMREMFTDANNFSASFPMDLDVRMKATLLGALFLIDFMYFEHKKNNNR